MSELTHYLVTQQRPLVNIHVYLVCRADEVERSVKRVGCWMDSIAAENGIPDAAIPLLLATKLQDSGRAAVLEIIAQMPKAQAGLDAMKDFHVTMWTTPTPNGDDDLMALH